MKKITNELKGKNVKELERETQKLREEVARLKLESKVNAQKDTNTLTKKRKRLAVVLTVLTEKKEIEKLKSAQLTKKK